MAGQCQLILAHFLHREVAADVQMNDEESSRAAAQNLVPEVVDTPSSSKGAIFLQVPASCQIRNEQIKTHGIQKISLGMQGGGEPDLK